MKERAVRMVRELRLADPKDQGVVTRVARQLGVGTESLRNWIKRDEIEAGLRPGMTEAERLELVSLRKEVRELRRVGVNRAGTAGDNCIPKAVLLLVGPVFEGCANWRPEMRDCPGCRVNLDSWKDSIRRSVSKRRRCSPSPIRCEK